MTQYVAIQIPGQSLAVPLPGLLALIAGEHGQHTQHQVADPFTLPAAIGAELQGGRYAGCLIEDGKLIHLIAAPEDLGDADWQEAKDKAGSYRGGGHDDWRLPSKTELQCAQAQAPELCAKARHWTATPSGSRGAWAVDFEHGILNISSRDPEFRVRPFRRLTL